MLEQNENHDPYSEIRGSLLSSEEVKKFSQLSPWKPLLQVFILWSQIFLAWFVVDLWTSWWVVLLALTFVGTRQYALHTIGHDGIHRRLLSNSKRNDLFCDLFIFGPEGAITRINGQNHLLHHRSFATEKDPDRHKYSSSNKTTRLELFYFLTGLSSLTALWNNVFNYTPSNAKPKKPYSTRDKVILFGCQSLLILGLSYGIGWWAYPILWLMPLYIFAYCGDLIRFFLEHTRPAPDHLVDDQRLISYTSSPLERVFFSPVNINLHATHHLWPSIPYYNLPAADSLIRSRVKSEKVFWKDSYVRELYKYYQALPLTGCKNPGV